MKHRRPWIHVDMADTDFSDAGNQVREWIERNHIQVMNIAGARASKYPEIYQATKALLGMIFASEKGNIS